MTSTAIGSKPVRIVAGLALALYASLALLAGTAVAHGRDGDGLPHKWEKNHGTKAHVADAKRDPDHDALSNRGEFRHDAEPLDQDTDDDGLGDGKEVKVFETEPDEADSDDDGVLDSNEDSDDDGLDNEDENDARQCDDDGEDGDDSDDSEDDSEDDSDDDDSDDDSDDSDDDSDDDESCLEEDEDDVFATVASFDAATGLLTLTTTSGYTFSATVTDETEIEFDSSGTGSGSDGSTADLVPGAGVTNIDFDDDEGVLEEVELART